MVQVHALSSVCDYTYIAKKNPTKLSPSETNTLNGQEKSARKAYATLRYAAKLAMTEVGHRKRGGKGTKREHKAAQLPATLQVRSTVPSIGS